MCPCMQVRTCPVHVFIFAFGRDRGMRVEERKAIGHAVYKQTPLPSHVCAHIDNEQCCSGIVSQHACVLDQRKQAVIHRLLHLLELTGGALHLILLVLHLAQRELHVNLTTCACRAEVSADALAAALQICNCTAP